MFIGAGHVCEDCPLLGFYASHHDQVLIRNDAGVQRSLQICNSHKGVSS